MIKALIITLALYSSASAQTMPMCTPCQCQAHANAKGNFLFPPSKECPPQSVKMPNGDLVILNKDGNITTLEAIRPSSTIIPVAESCDQARYVCATRGMPYRARCVQYDNEKPIVTCSTDGKTWQ